MRTSSPTRIGFAVALAVGVLLFAAPRPAVAGEAPAGPEPSLPDTSAGCLNPCTAAYWYAMESSGVHQFADPNDPLSFSSDPATCAKQCNALAGACKKVWQAAVKCWKGWLGKGEGGYLKAACLEEADPGACKTDVKSELAFFMQILTQDTACAQYYCASALSWCNLQCLSAPL